MLYSEKYILLLRQPVQMYYRRINVTFSMRQEEGGIDSEPGSVYMYPNFLCTIYTSLLQGYMYIPPLSPSV